MLINIFPQIPDFNPEPVPGGYRTADCQYPYDFAIIAVCIEIFFTRQIIQIVYKIIPLKPEETKSREDRIWSIWTQFSRVPTGVALHQAQLEISRMGRIAADNLQNAVDCFFREGSGPGTAGEGLRRNRQRPQPS